MGALAEAGIGPAANGSYRQRVPVMAPRGFGAEGALTVDGRPVAVLDRDLVITSGMGAPVDLTAPLAVVRWSNATAALPQDVPLAALAGAIVIVERLGDPLGMLSQATTDTLAALGSTDPAAVLSVTGDLAGLLAEAAAGADTDAAPGWRDVRATDEAASGISGQIDAQVVAGLAGPAPDPATLATAAITLLPDPVTLTIGFDRFERRAFDELNVTARIPGRDPGAGTVLLTAHYDHLGMIDGVLYPGADDNLSGVATVLEAARDLAADPPAADVEIVFFTGEEHGLVGSRAFAAALPGPATDYAALFNIDAIGRPQSDDPAYENTVFASGLGCWPQVDRAAAAASGLDRLELSEEPTLALLDGPCTALVTGTAGPPSDQMPLIAAGVPGLLPVGGLNADYHGPGDTADKLDDDRLARVAAFLAAAARAIGKD